MHQRKRVLMLLGYYSYKMHLGIARYAKEVRWALNASMAVSGTIPDGWRCDGIVTFSSGRDDVADEIRKQDVPVVDLSSFNPDAPYPIIYSDQVRIGQMGAEHFLVKGFQYFGFIGGTARNQGFRDCVEKAGRTFFDISFNTLKDRIHDFPKPLALMARDDTQAIPVLDVIHEAGYAIPHDVAVLGVDDNELQNSLALVPLSSIDTSAELRGYEAAKLLDKLMAGENAPEEPIVIPPSHVVTRASTDVMAIADPNVLSALKELHDNYANAAFDFDFLATRVGVCRHHLDNKFKQHLGHSMYEEIMRVRLVEVKRLLTETDYRAKTIARLCGFSCTDHLSVTIQKRFGCRVREYRKQLCGSL